MNKECKIGRLKSREHCRKTAGKTNNKSVFVLNKLFKNNSIY
jgi:hypothetical protein